MLPPSGWHRVLGIVGVGVDGLGRAIVGHGGGGRQAMPGVQEVGRDFGLGRPDVARAPLVARRLGVARVAHQVVAHRRFALDAVVGPLEPVVEPPLRKRGIAPHARVVRVFQPAGQLAVAEGAHHELLITAGPVAALVLQADEGVDVALAEDVVPAADVDAGRFDLAEIMVNVALGERLVVGLDERTRHVGRRHSLLAQPLLVEVLHEHAARIPRVVIGAAVGHVDEGAQQVRRAGHGSQVGRDAGGRAAEHSHLAVGPRLRGGPFDRVVTVFHVLGEGPIVALAGEASAAILHDVRVAVVGVVGFGLGAVGRLPLVVGRSGEHDRPGAIALGQEHVGGQLHAVAHGHHDFQRFGQRDGRRDECCQENAQATRRHNGLGPIGDHAKSLVENKPRFSQKNGGESPTERSTARS